MPGYTWSTYCLSGRLKFYIRAALFYGIQKNTKEKDVVLQRVVRHFFVPCNNGESNAFCMSAEACGQALCTQFVPLLCLLHEAAGRPDSEKWIFASCQKNAGRRSAAVLHAG